MPRDGYFDGIFKTGVLRLLSLSRILQTPGGPQDIRMQGGQSKKSSGNPNISLQLHCNPKISAHFILIKPVHEHEISRYNANRR